MSKDISQADVMTAFLRCVLDYGQAGMAGKLDIAVSTLSNKLQPFKNPDRRHYLNFFEADDILTITGDMSALELLAARHGFALLPLEATPDRDTWEAEALEDFQSLTRYQAEGDPLKSIHALNAHLREVLETQAIRSRETKEARGRQTFRKEKNAK